MIREDEDRIHPFQAWRRLTEAGSPWEPHRDDAGRVEALRHRETGEVVRVAGPDEPTGSISPEHAEALLSRPGWSETRRVRWDGGTERVLRHRVTGRTVRVTGDGPGDDRQS